MGLACGQDAEMVRVDHADDDDIYIMVKCLYVCNVFAYFYV